MANAKENSWPLLEAQTQTESKWELFRSFWFGGRKWSNFSPLFFYLQEWPQVECCRLYTKFACRPSSLEVLPRVVSKAVRSTIAGRPEVANIDFPGDLLRKSSDIALPSQVTAVIKAPIMRRPLEATVKEAIDSLSKAERPLIIVGKGTAFF